MNVIAACVLAMIFVLFSFALLSSYDCSDNQGHQEGQAPRQQGGECESWRHFATKDPAGLFTLWLAVVGFFQAGFFIWQLDLIRRGLADTKEAADAATEQAKVARESLIASNRAWIKVTDVQLTSDLEIAENGARAMISFRLTNVGNTPALRVTPWVRLGVVRRDGLTIPRFHRDCEAIARMPPPGEFSIFPGDTFPPAQEALVYPANIGQTDFQAGVMAYSVGHVVTPLLLICILYRFPSDQDRYHQTRVVLEIQNKWLDVIDPRPNKVALNDLRVIGSSWENNLYAD